MSAAWLAAIGGMIAVGILSRVVHTGFVLFDKYLGDALYAAMIYGILRLFALPTNAALWAMTIMTALELFQLTLIPLRMLASGHLLTRMCARLLGVQFSFFDLLTYGAGIACIFGVEFAIRNHSARRGVSSN